MCGISASRVVMRIQDEQDRWRWNTLSRFYDTSTQRVHTFCDDTPKRRTIQEMIVGANESGEILQALRKLKKAHQLKPSKWPFRILSPIGEGARCGRAEEVVVARLCFVSRGYGRFGAVGLTAVLGGASGIN